MARKGLSRDKVLAEAVMMVEEAGFDKFSMHSLAARLGVKTASLYNHIENVDQIGLEIAKIAITSLREQMDNAIQDTDDTSTVLMRIAIAYRMFARQKPEMYKVILNLPALHGKTLIHTILTPMREALSPFARNEQDLMSILRAYRSMIHGFVSLEALGYFEYPGVTIDQSYLAMIRSFIDSITSRDPAESRFEGEPCHEQQR